MQVDEALVRKIKQSMRDHLAALEDEMGVVVTVGRASFTKNHVEIQVDVATVSDDGTVNDKYVEDFRRFRSRYGLKDSVIGATFEHKGDMFKVRGAKPRSRKYPIVAENTKDGSIIRFGHEYVQEQVDQKHRS